MTRRNFLSLIAAVATIAIAMFTGNATADAQPCPPGCTYAIDATCAIPPECFPLSLTTRWHCLNAITATTIFVNQCGIQHHPKPGPCQPVPCDMLWASLDGGTTIAYPNGPGVDYTCNDGRVLCLSLIRSCPDGCYTVRITPGPCPIAP